MTDYGEYNGEITKKKKDSLDIANTSSSNAIKKVIVKNYSESTIKQGPYIGYVLRVDKKDVPWYAIFKSEWTAKVRVPELDAHIPEPEDFGPKVTDELDLQKIELHPTYMPRGQKVKKVPTVGAKVLVERDDNGQQSFIIEILEEEGQESEKPKGKGPKGAHGKGGPGGGGGGGKGKKGRRYKGGPSNNKNNSAGLTGFRAFKRSAPPVIIVIHESGGSNLKSTENILKGRGLGVHYLVDNKTKRVIEYEDWKENYLIHCPGFNRQTIGIEYNHAYHGTDNLLKPCKFYWKRKYNIPETDALEQCYGLVDHLCQVSGIPFTMPQMISGNKFTFKGGVGKNMASGVVSHVAASPNHGDGNYMCLYFAIRQAGHSPADAGKIAFDIAKVATNWSTHTIPVGSASLPPKQVTIEKYLPLTWEERRKHPQYAS